MLVTSLKGFLKHLCGEDGCFSVPWDSPPIYLLLLSRHDSFFLFLIVLPNQPVISAGF